MQDQTDDFNDIHLRLITGKSHNIVSMIYKIQYFFDKFNLKKYKKPEIIINELNLKEKEHIQKFYYISSALYIHSQKQIPKDFWKITELSEEQQISVLDYSLLNKKTNFYKKVVEKKLPFEIKNKDNITSKEILILSILHHTGVNTSLQKLIKEVFKDDQRFNKEAFVKMLDIRTVTLIHLNLLSEEQINILKEIKVTDVMDKVSKKHYIYSIPQESNVYDYFLAKRFFYEYTKNIAVRINEKISIDEVYLSKEVFSIISPIIDLKQMNSSKDSQDFLKKIKYLYLEKYLKIEGQNNTAPVKRSKI